VARNEGFERDRRIDELLEELEALAMAPKAIQAVHQVADEGEIRRRVRLTAGPANASRRARSASLNCPGKEGKHWTWRGLAIQRRITRARCAIAATSSMPGSNRSADTRICAAASA